MSKKQLRISPTSVINIQRCNGRLSIRGGASGAVVYESKGFVDVEQVGDEVMLSANGDCTISVPQNVPVRVQSVAGRFSAKMLYSLALEEARGSVKIEGITTSLVLGSVNGDLEVKKSNAILANDVHGDIEFKDISSDIQIANARSDFNVRRCHGKIEVNQIKGSVYGSGITGELKLDSVKGEAVLQGPLSAGKHHIIASGDVIVHWPPQSKVQFLVTHSGKLFNNLNLPYDVSKQGEFQATIGDDSCKLIIESKEDVFLWPYQSEKSKSKSKDTRKSQKSKSKKKKDFDLDLDDLLDPEELIEKVGKGIKSMVKGRKSGSQSGQGRGLFSKIFDSAMREVDEWAGVPEERARREEARQPAPAKNVEEERRMILKMLENGAISVDEATERLKKL